jgi:hypothetical protein
MKTALLIFSLAAGLCLHAQARLGETINQTEARYGKPVRTFTDEGFPAMEFSFGGMKVTVDFLDGKSGQEQFAKPDEGAFSDHEIALILQANAGGKDWAVKPVPSDSMKHWSLSDGSAEAFYEVAAAKVLVQTRAKIDAEDRVKETAEADRLKGL